MERRGYGHKYIVQVTLYSGEETGKTFLLESEARTYANAQYIRKEVKAAELTDYDERADGYYLIKYAEKE